GMVHAMVAICREHGFRGLWRGSFAAVPRTSVGSASQLTSFATVKELVVDLQGMVHAMVAICREHGFRGLWRGSFAAVPRTSVGSASQLTSFATVKELVVDLQVSSA
ncbi:hypothetical protein CRUP_002755, partial [Coryphaenoides rupestris]